MVHYALAVTFSQTFKCKWRWCCVSISYCTAARAAAKHPRRAVAYIQTCLRSDYPQRHCSIAPYLQRTLSGVGERPLYSTMCKLLTLTCLWDTTLTSERPPHIARTIKWTPNAQKHSCNVLKHSCNVLNQSRFDSFGFAIWFGFTIQVIEQNK